MHSLYGDFYTIRGIRTQNTITYTLEDERVVVGPIHTLTFKPEDALWEEMLTKFSTDFSKAENV